MKIVSSSSGGGVKIELLLTYFPPDYGNSLPTYVPPIMYNILIYHTYKLSPQKLIIIK